MRRHHADHVDFEKLKRTVTLPMVLAHYGIELRQQGAQLYGPCPIHGGTGKRQFVVNPKTNEWHCFGDCKRGGAMLEFVAEKERLSAPEAAALVASWFAVEPARPQESQRQPRRQTMSGEKPSHKVYVIEGEGENSFWHRAGSAWSHGDKKGLTLQIPTGMSLSGRVVLREFDPEEDEQDAKTKRKK